MILSITGPSGVGKTTLLHNLLKELPQAKTLISFTTREPRPTDEPGEYAYISKEEFDAMTQRGEFLWEAHTYVNHYGTRKIDIDQALTEGFYMPVLVIDAVKKLHAYAKEVGKEKALHSIYIHIDDEEELRRRFKERGDSPEETEARIKECRTWNEQAKTAGVTFMYLEARKKREEILADALAAIKKEVL